ncbi:DNA-binding transcriptional response regulator, NtrC family, contains REC, AAA-type ATPase, and a Fis-type DNA-binding domains [Ferrimonas sediminum]|uniref:DNA-binding transcriptional response regulator, NtrC family, contains REC, AAA-type ATPase, and a Fis-type DNA-binding domains n=1 Tax=Ferrimonas sediminum TaxID=718193 RepID=A0A1G8XEL9_9GAMM|nr:sigma-54-dependent Fis family transcriptional regulator [Ferrimonas sediminum]SDJ89059.1 DNA-binding transcriptional response regulator, NtrC family, contains REC, AAA-type ATPase, and a Fis-type DNA-binding domains [Ferrimonas sediminum]
MLSSEINPREFLDFLPDEGLIKFKDQRMVLLDAVALGLLRKELIDQFGTFVARCILTRFGYAHGWRTGQILSSEFPEVYLDPQSGSHLHMLFGITKTFAFKPRRGDDNTLLEVHWHNSYEAEQHQLSIGESDDPVCWTLTGFASGFESWKHNREVYFIEDMCTGKGDPYCRVTGKFKEDWGEELEPHKPFFSMASSDSLLKELTKRLELTQRALKASQQGKEPQQQTVEGFITQNREMTRLIQLAARVAKVDSSVVVSGESGVGKERLSRFIHERSNRSAQPFVAINCGALTETLLESELFGHKRGAFTGADRDRAGLFEEADKGTLFLDEIGEISAAMQLKLLRTLQEQEVRRVGENHCRKVNVRIICATNRNLEQEVAQGHFRADLYYRLCVVELKIPSLRQRHEDILPLARSILESKNRQMGRNIRGFSNKVARILEGHSWPGNIREMQNVVEYCTALCHGREITTEDLPASLNAPANLPQRIAAHALSLEEMEREYILSVVRACKGNKAQAMKILSIGKATLYRKLKEYGWDAAT